MKISRTNPLHWVLFVLSLTNTIIAVLLRPLLKRRARPRIALYGHKLGGNLLALRRRMGEDPGGPEVAFLTMDPGYHRELVAGGESSVLLASPRCIPWLAKADALISDHGLHALQPLLYFSDLKFFDVWHGIPFKGFDADDFHTQHRYDEAWVASPLLADMYVKRFGFRPDRVVATGYARTDRLVRERDIDSTPIRRRLGLPADAGRIVLFAPTWQQDASDRSVFPFGADADTFCRALSDLAKRADATVVLRTHLNSGAVASVADRYPRLLGMPYATHPDTEEILLASDVLVCDWSSIAFDFLLLDRPTIFLDVPPPFRKGFSLDRGYRFGAIASEMDAMAEWIEVALSTPQVYWNRHATSHADVRQAVYGGCDDGRAAERCLQRLHACLSSDPR